MNLGEMDLDAAAKEAAGNWKNFDCFSWHRRSQLADADNHVIVYTHHRDSGLLDQSNAAEIAEALEPFGDSIFTCANCALPMNCGSSRPSTKTPTKFPRMRTSGMS